MTSPGRDRKPTQGIIDPYDTGRSKRFRDGDLILSRYRITGELGQGGMGVVYRCHDDVSGIDVALKAIPPELSHNTIEMEEVRENFQLVASLVHTNIAQMRTLDRDDETGDYYLIMEYVEGMTLRQYRKKKGGKLSFDNVMKVVNQIGSALDYAHSQKIMHRDIKPTNVMVTMDETVKVLDFGLASQIHTSMSHVSQANYSTSGTGPYMAPEQWRGQYQDSNTDQYALGVLTYEMMAGKCPFESHEIAVLREAVLNDSPVRIDLLNSRAWKALTKALSKDRKHRYHKISEFTKTLDDAQNGKVSAIASLGEKTRATAFAVCAGTIVVLLLLAMINERNKEPKPEPIPTPAETVDTVVSPEPSRRNAATRSSKFRKRFPPKEKKLEAEKRKTAASTENPTTVLASSKAYLNILIKPDGSTISIDGKPVRQGRITLLPGKHVIKIEKAGFHTFVKAYNITGGEELELKMLLKKRPNLGVW